MPMIYILADPSNKVDISRFEDHSREAGFKPEQVVFLFPGNKSHHTSKTTLFSNKGGAGLAQAAANIGRKGYPTLSLPTTNMEQWEISQNIKETVDGAMADLYRAVGAGFQLMLPVRKHENTTYFDKGLENAADKELEPSFWGGVLRAANKPLAGYYIDQLDILNQFFDLSEEAREQDNENIFFKYYLEGKRMALENHSWVAAPGSERASKASVAAVENETLSSSCSDDEDQPLTKPRTSSAPVSKANVGPVARNKYNSSDSDSDFDSLLFLDNRNASSASPDTSHEAPDADDPYDYDIYNTPEDAPEITEKTHAAYQRLYDKVNDPLLKARELLVDYTKHNSFLLRLFHAHLGRHHVKEVNALVHKIGTEIKDVDSLLEKLREIKPINAQGSLARRIYFIEKNNPDAHAEQNTPSL